MKIVYVMITALLTACSHHLSPGEVSGTYIISVDGGADTIKLNIDGNYTHDFKTNNGKNNHQEGTWRLEDLSAGQTVILNRFLPLYGKDEKLESIHLLRVEKTFWAMYLITNIDLDTGYRKIS